MSESAAKRSLKSATADADAKLDGLALTDWDRAAILFEYLRNLPEPFVPWVELLPEVVVLVISMLTVLTLPAQ